VEWNDTVHDVPDATVPGRFAEQVARTPGAPAVISDRTTLTYAQLDERSDALASRLARHGLPAEAPVALLMDRSVALVVAELAILKAGGAYLPLDVRAPASRMRLLLAETGADILITDRTWQATAHSVHDGHIVVADAESVDTPGQVERPPHPDSLAY